MTDEEYIKNISSVSTEELFNQLEYYGYDSYYTVLWRATIEELKKRTEQSKWIPVSERLPEEETDVMVCNANGDVEIATYSTEINEFIWYTSGWKFAEVIAWQPLPEPYKEEENER